MLQKKLRVEKFNSNLKFMNLGEIKQLINASGGKLILSDGNLKDSFIVMKIDDYLLEKGIDCDYSENDSDFNQHDFIENGDGEENDLTDAELLDKINSDIEELKKRKQENELTSVIESDFLCKQKEEELNYEKI
jgi:hypothetical protein